MNKLLMGACLTMAMQVGHSQTLPQLGKDPIEKIVAAMTAEEKVSLFVGTGMPGFGGQSAVVGSTQNLVPGAAGTTFPIERLGIPAIVVADGPAGLRISPTREGNEATYYCTAFPVATLLASTWNTALVKNVGNAMGDEVKEYGCDVLLAPALNIHRSPLCGRNFEYYSEDPYLTGRIATAMVNGIQSNGVGTSIKHFAVNNQETNRTGTDARLTPRALREIYLRGFEMVVKEASPWTVMSSYNKINGEYASESRDLLTTILRDEWGFSGLVMTDWFGGKNAPAQIHAGNDLLMPGRPDQKEALLKALEDGSLSIENVDTDVTRVLRLILQSPRFAQYAYSDKPDLKAHAEVTRASASEGMVLLKNTNNALPLAPGIKKIAAYGTTSYDFIAGGTGSGDVNEAYTVSLVEGLENAGYTMDAEVKALYEKYSTEEKAKQPKDTSPAAAFFNHPRIPEFVPDAAGLAAKAKEADIAFVTIGRSSGEFQDRKIEGDFNLTENDLDQMEAQGLDVSKYREKLAARRAKEAEEAKRDRELYKNPTQLDKLKPYMQTPRSSETEFFRKLAGKAPWLGKSKWLRKFTEGYIVYAGIVSAPAEAWKGVKHKDDSFHGIGIYALDKGHMNDVEWLKRVMEKLRNMCEGRQPVAPGCEGVVSLAKEEDCWSTVKLSGEIVEGADVEVRKLVLYYKELPQGYLPSDGIVPHFYWEGTIRVIPAELYV